MFDFLNVSSDCERIEQWNERARERSERLQCASDCKNPVFLKLNFLGRNLLFLLGGKFKKKKSFFSWNCPCDLFDDLYLLRVKMLMRFFSPLAVEHGLREFLFILRFREKKKIHRFFNRYLLAILISLLIIISLFLKTTI